MNRTGTNITAIPHSRYLTNSLINFISLFAEIVKIKITVLVSLTTALGYFLGVEKISLEVIYPVIGIFILACGSAALNQYQERDEDLLMNRTKNRPIPSDRITPGSVLFISLVLLIMGSFILILKTNLTTLIIGLLAFFWYNGIYTPLKKKMVFAIIPGSIVGALPPLAGWAATGSNIFDINILFVAFYFFVWQIPHFWLLLTVLGKDYEKAGFPTFSKLFSREQFSRIIFMWISATVVTALLIPLFGIIRNPVTDVGLLFAGIWLTVKAIKLLKSYDDKLTFKFAFREINIFAIIIVLLLSLDKLIVM